MIITGIVHLKFKFGHCLLTLMSFQICMTFLLLQKTKKDVLKNVSNQTVLVTIVDTLSSIVFHRIKNVIQLWNYMKVSE